MPSPLTLETSIDEIVENFSFLEEWDDRYGYLIELGKALHPLDPSQMNETTKVQGCVSQVWVVGTVRVADGQKVLDFQGASDAHIVRGLVAIALTLFSGKSPKEIMDTDEQGVFQAIGLQEHLTPQRSNGLRAMVRRLKEMAHAEIEQG